MLRNHIALARTMAQRLFDAEVAVDNALRTAAELAAFMPQARQEANVSAALGQDAFDGITATMQVLSNARRQLVETHHALAETQGRIGIRERNFGGFVDKPKSEIGLEIVETAAA